jgi:signal transduction histidine kinase
MSRIRLTYILLFLGLVTASCNQNESPNLEQNDCSLWEKPQLDSAFRSLRKEAKHVNQLIEFGQLDEGQDFTQKLLPLIDCHSNFEFLYRTIESHLLFQEDKFQGAVKSTKRALTLAEDQDSLHLQRQALIGLAKVYSKAEMEDTAYAYFQKAIALYTDRGLPYDTLGLSQNMVANLIDMGRLDEADSIIHLVIDQADSTNRLLLLINKGFIEDLRENYDSSWQYTLQSWELAEALNDSISMAYIMRNQSSILYEIGDLDSAFWMFVKSADLMSSLQNNKYSERIAAIELEFEDLKRDQALQDLEEQSEQDRLYRFYLISLTLALLLGIIFIYLFFRNRIINQRKLQRESELRIQKEMELASIHSTLEAIDEKRKRVAMDLHDGIGVLASTARLRVSQVTKRLKDEQLRSVLEDSSEALLEITKDVKRIAHNMMPSTLHKLGLRAACDDLAERLAEASGIQIHTHLGGLDSSGLGAQRISIYRIMQEMLNNGIKYSNATEISLKATAEGSNLHLQYTDNGVGTDAQRLESGNGMRTMQSRVERLKGSLRLKTEPGKGMDIQILIPRE